MTRQQQFIHLIKKYLSNDADAVFWTIAYVAYCHGIDDVIDGDKTDYEFILLNFRTAISLYTYHWFQKHQDQLIPLLITAHDSYRDSVCMERSLRQEDWEKHVGDVIRQNTLDVILMIIFIVSGLEARNQAALEFRKLAYETHHENGVPV
jgi:hypothetical protein